MNAAYISLDRLAQSMGVYDSKPVPIQQGLKNTVILTIITNIVCIPIMIFTPNIGYFSSLAELEQEWSHRLPCFEPIVLKIYIRHSLFISPLLANTSE